MYNIKWLKRDDKSDTLTSIIKKTDDVFYQNISIILKICCTFLIASCDCERSIGVLRLLKTFFRSTMGQNRLTSLTVMHVYRSFSINTKEGVAIFARRHSRRMGLSDTSFELRYIQFL